VSSVGDLKLLRFNTSLSVVQAPACPTIGVTFQGLPFGDVDCSGSINSVDALKVLRFVAQLSVTQKTVALPSVARSEQRCVEFSPQSSLCEGLTTA
jgi:hypothetical protein